ncbi:MAG: cytochrome c biogenesis protein CcdA [Chloroflexota bacterium]
MQLSFSLALIAGLVSFLSPCVLPLVPAYIGYMSGRVTNTVAAQTGGTGVMVAPSLGSRFSTLLHGLAFVGGFAFVFVAIGLLSTVFVSQIGRQNIVLVTNIIGRAGGLLIIFFGLHFMGVLPAIFNRILARPQVLRSPLISFAALITVCVALLWVFEDGLLAAPVFVLFLLWLFLGGAFRHPGTFWTKAILLIQRALYTDTRRQMIAQGHQSYAGSAMMGVVFSAGWTPCIGPIYGSILTLAALNGDAATAGTLLLAYSLGLGIPFLAAAFLLDGAQGILRRLQRHLHKIELVSGAFLVLIGVLVATGRLQYLSQNFATQFADFSYNLEACVIKLNQGEIGLGELLDCANHPNSTTTAVAAAPTVVTTQTATDTMPSILDLAASAPEITEVGLEVGKIAPGFTTTTDTGEPFSLAEQRGKVVLLNFWATWCGPCRVEMPEFQKAFSGHSSGDFIIVGVNNAENSEQIDSFRDEYALTFPLLLDESAAIQEQYAILSYPSTFVIDPDGIIITQHYGPLTAEQIDTLVSQALS